MKVLQMSTEDFRLWLMTAYEACAQTAENLDTPETAAAIRKMAFGVKREDDGSWSLPWAVKKTIRT